MAKDAGRATRNRIKLQDNRTSNEPVFCSMCENDALLSWPREVQLTKRHRCFEHRHLTKHTQSAKLLARLKSYGLL